MAQTLTAIADLPDNLQQACALAVKAHHNAYSPYSRFRVGSCIVHKDGKTMTAAASCEVANSQVVCGERSCLWTANARGYRQAVAVAIYGKPIGAPMEGTDTPVTPCGICRQSLQELAVLSGVDLTIVSMTADPSMCLVRRLSELLPHAFGPNNLNVDLGRWQRGRNEKEGNEAEEVKSEGAECNARSSRAVAEAAAAEVSAAPSSASSSLCNGRPPKRTCDAPSIDAQLIATAVEYASYAYAPYSQRGYGAALLDADGSTITPGASCENCVFQGCCAERQCLLAANSAGRRRHLKIATYGRILPGVGSESATSAPSAAFSSPGGIGLVAPPCGLCRQFLQEFAELWRTSRALASARRRGDGEAPPAAEGGVVADDIPEPPKEFGVLLVARGGEFYWEATLSELFSLPFCPKDTGVVLDDHAQ